MEAELRALFYSEVIQFADSLGFMVASPNVAFDPKNVPSTQNCYLRASVMPADPEHIGVNNDEARYVWIAQVSVYVRDGVGELVPLRHAEALRDEFPRFHKFTSASHTFRVERVGSIASPIALAGWYSVPVSFRIQTIH